MPKIKTSDLYYSAYLLSHGSTLEEVMLDDNGKRRITFEFSNPEIQRLAGDYQSGRAQANVRYLKSSLEHLKDIIFEKKGLYR